MDFQHRVKIAPDVLFRAFESEAILLNLKTETYFELDDVGTHVWQHITASSTIQAAYESLLDEYDVEPAQLEADMIDLLSQLLDNGLIALIDE